MFTLRTAINVSFTDGHARRVPLEDLWTLVWHKGFGPREVALP